MTDSWLNQPGPEDEETNRFGIVDLLADPTVYECEKKAVGDKGALLIDAGVHARGGWRAGLLALAALYAGNGYADYGRIETESGYLPSVDSYLDNAARASFSFLQENKHGVRGDCEKLGVRLIDTVSPDWTDGFVSARSVMVFAAGSFLHHVISAAGVLAHAVCLVEQLLESEHMLWAWGKAPLVLRRLDSDSVLQVQQEALSAGSISALWVRADDEKLASFCGSWQGAGEIRLHNVGSGNTFIGGRCDHDALWRVYTNTP